MNPFRFPLDHPVSALSACAAVLLFGLISLPLLPFEELPEIDIPEYRIISSMPGFPPEEMEQLVTIPLENALSGVHGIRESEAFTGTGISLLILRLDWGVDAHRCADELREAVDDQYPLLPRKCSKPVLLTESSGRRPFMTLAIEAAAGTDSSEYHRVIRDELREELQKMEEISLAEFRGLRESEIRVLGDTDLLSSLNLSLSSCADAIADSLISRSAGKVSIGGREQLVKLDHNYENADDLADLRPFPGIALRLGEMAEIRRVYKKRTSLFLLNGREAVGLRLYKSGNTGTLAASRAVMDVLPSLEEIFGDELKITLLKDYGAALRQSRSSLFSALTWGLAAALVVLYGIYRDPVIPVITSLAVPVTIIPVFFILYLAERGLNTLSLTGMIVGIGLIADADIVVLEELSSGAEDCSTVFSAILSSVLTTVIVFLPPLFLPGAPGILFRDLIMTIIVTILFSLPVAFILTPALWSLMTGRNRRPEKGPRHSSAAQNEGKMGRLDSVYRGLLKRTMRHPRLWRNLLLLFSLIGITAGIHMPVELLPSSAAADLIIKAELPGNLEAEKIVERTVQISNALLQKLPGSRVLIESGRDESSLRDRGNPEAALHRLTIEITEKRNGIKPFFSSTGDDKKLSALSPPDRDEKIFRILTDIPDLSRIRIEEEQSVFAALLNPGKNSSVLLAEDRKTLSSIIIPPGLEETWSTTALRLQFMENDDAMDAAGVKRGRLVQELQALLNGVPAGEIQDKSSLLKITVRGREEYRKDSIALSRFLLPAEEGAVALDSLGRFQLIREQTLLSRRNRHPSLQISDRPGNTTVLEDLPPGIHLEKRETLSRDASQLPELILLSLVLLYLILGMQTASFADALLLMICPLLSLTGALLTLQLFTPSLTLHAFMGLLILQGTAVNTGILLVDGFREIKGNPDKRRLIYSARKRVRPVMATVLTTSAALLPIIIEALIRRDRQADTAIAVTGGLLFGTVFIMILLPSLYGALHNVR